MANDNHSLLGFALMGLINQRQTCSGYDLRKIFAQTPMGTFSNSPGAIYPALQRLEELGLIRGRVEETHSARRRKLYRLSSKGEAALKQWLVKPVGQEDLIHGLGELSLRFAFMEDVADRGACIKFLESLARELVPYIAVLQGHLKTLRAKMPLSSRLALEDGIMGYQSKLAWTRMAIEEFRAK